MLWTDEVIVKLRALWDEGHSTAEIGRRLGITKNAVVGKAHRLDLPSRPSPIRRDGAGPARRRTTRRICGPTLPPLASIRVTPPASAVMAPGAVESAAAVRPDPRAMPTRVADRPLDARPVSERPVMERPVMERPRLVVASGGQRSLRVVACCWPMGEPGTRSFRFCDEPSTPGKPYCALHADQAYVRVRRREDAA